MGFSMRTATARYTEWVRWNGTVAAWGRVEGVELYMHPGSEDTNIALAPAQRDVVAALSLQLRAAFGGPPRCYRQRGSMPRSDEF